MNRRKFILGLGSLAATGTAVTSTGAFTSVEADRTVSVDVVGDSSAYLSFQKAADEQSDPGANSDAYVDDSGDAISFDFRSSNETADLGDGFNIDAVTRIEDLLEVRNQGTQSVFLSVDLQGLRFIDDEFNNPYVGMGVKTDATASSYENANIVFNSENANAFGGVVDNPRDDGAAELIPGESYNLDLVVDTTDLTGTITLKGGTITFIANQESSL